MWLTFIFVVAVVSALNMLHVYRSLKDPTYKHTEHEDMDSEGGGGSIVLVP